MVSPSEEQTYTTFVVLFHAKTDSEVSFRMVRENFVVLIEIGMHLIKCNWLDKSLRLEHEWYWQPFEVNYHDSSIV